MALETKNKNAILSLIILLVACFIAFNFIYKKQQQELQGLIAQKEVETKKNAVLENIVRIEKGIATFRALLVKKDISDAINTINNLAKASGIKIVSIKPPATEEKTAEYVKASFDISLAASSYHSLGRFISSLESYPDVYIVDSVTITSQEQDKELTANLTVSTFTVPEER